MDNITRNYFSHDSNARNSNKLINVRMRHGAAGYGVYFMILERLREEKEYMSIKDYNMIAFDFRVDASLIKSIVEEFGLFVFTEDGKYFYSESLSRRMGIKDDVSKKRSEAGKRGMAKRYGKQIIDNENVESVNLTKEQQSYNNVIAMLQPCYNKKRKEKESKDTPPQTPPHGEVSSSMEEEIFFENSFFQVRNPQTLSAAVLSMGGTEDYLTDLLRMSNGGEPGSPIWYLLDEMRRSKGRITMVDTIRAMAEYERRGLLNCKSKQLVRIEGLLKETVKSEEMNEILSALTFPAREQRCIQAVEEVRKSNGKIRQPAKYILSELAKVPAI